MDQQQPSKASSQRNPTELLQAQYDTLAAMYAEQSAQNRRMVIALENIDARFANQLTSVKIEDFNMPFMAMVGMIVKIALASIPAALIIGVLTACAWLTVVSGLFAALSS